ncbi:hypothetical protein TKK_0003211 [Trichogramma kaykai]|uniref:Ankyrin repeat domain-containing protein n=1 Tax=Trichogramma kaykai TaxID=54128 RepID=A0ABD2WSU9_9HYME
MIGPEDHDLDVPNPLRRERAERLMFHSVTNSNIDNILALYCLHYRDPGPELDEAGRPRLRRDTPLHLGARLERSPRAIDLLFRMYGANYVDASGMTHFHVACQYGFRQRVEAFPESAGRRADRASPRAGAGDRGPARGATGGADRAGSDVEPTALASERARHAERRIETRRGGGVLPDIGAG